MEINKIEKELLSLLRTKNVNKDDIGKFIDIHNLDVNFKNTTPLIVSIEENRIDIVKLLIEKGADVNKVSPRRILTDLVEYYTPLGIAIKFYQNIDIVKLLIEKGANIKYVNEEGETYLMLACWKLNGDVFRLGKCNNEYYIELFDILLDKISVEEKNNRGSTCINYLSSDKSEKIFKEIQNSINILNIILHSYDKHFTKDTDKNIFELDKIHDHENIFREVLNFLIDNKDIIYEEEEEYISNNDDYDYETGYDHW